MGDTPGMRRILAGYWSDIRWIREMADGRWQMANSGFALGTRRRMARGAGIYNDRGTGTATRTTRCQLRFGGGSGGALVRLPPMSSGNRPLRVRKGWKGIWKGSSMTLGIRNTGSALGSLSVPVTLYSKSLVTGQNTVLTTGPTSHMSRNSPASTFALTRPSKSTVPRHR